MTLAQAGSEYVLQGIALGVSGWTLVTVISLKTTMAALGQKVKDLPCTGRMKCAGKDEDEP